MLAGLAIAWLLLLRLLANPIACKSKLIYARFARSKYQPGDCDCTAIAKANAGTTAGTRLQQPSLCDAKLK